MTFILIHLYLSMLSLELTDVSSVRAPSSEEVVIAIIRAEDSQFASPDTLRRMVLGFQANWPNGRRGRIVLPGSNSPDYDVIGSLLFGSSGRGMTRHWLQRVFSGQTQAPVFVDSTVEIIDQVISQTSAIGVVSSMPQSLPQTLIAVRL